MEEKRYYWIKLTDRFITSDTVDFLMSQPNGAEYVVLYQMLCLKTVNTGGELARHLGEIIVPYDAKKIQRDCKYFSLDTITVALHLYKQLGLVYESEEGILKIANYDRLIGSEGESAERMRRLRSNRKGQEALPSHCDAQSAHGKKDSSPTPPTENTEKEIEKDKETPTDKDITHESVGQSALSSHREEGSESPSEEDENVAFYRDFLIEHLNGGRKTEFVGQDAHKFKFIINHLAEKPSFKIGDRDVPAADILHALQYYVAGGDNDQRITQVYSYIADKVASGAVKNELNYTIATLYQKACNEGYGGQ